MSESPDPAQPRLVAPWWRLVYVLLGLLMAGFGLAGAYLPVLPTTPFLLLATYFLARSSPKLNQLIHRLPVFGRYLREWDEHRGVRLEVKCWASVVAVASGGGGLWLSRAEWWIIGLVIGLVVVGLIVVWSLPTIQHRGDGL